MWVLCLERISHVKDRKSPLWYRSSVTPLFQKKSPVGPATSPWPRREAVLWSSRGSKGT